MGAKWFDPSVFPASESRPIRVPGTITDAWPNSAPFPRGANLVWYMRTFTPEVATAPGLRQYLRFGSVRYLSEVWLNGVDLGTHEGGEDPFEIDVTNRLLAGKANTLILRVQSPCLGGINQHVSLVAEPEVRLIDGFARPDAKAGVIRLKVTLENNTGAPASVGVTASFGEYKPQRALGSQSASVAVPPGRTTATLILNVPQAHLWSLDDPFLYTIAISSQWQGAPSEATGRDDCSFRTGFRDFRITDGYFYLNGKRIFLKSAHGNWYEPIVIQGTPAAMDYMSQDFPLLKKAGFNTMRFITWAALPEQLDQADELGFLVYSEHETSWPVLFVDDVAKFGITLNQVVRRDRNHPSLVMWGLLNETSSLAAYNRAKAWLPELRSIDDTRLVMLSSGRWDEDFKTASASNPGSSTWNVYMGGEDPVNPVTTGSFLDEVGGYGFFPGAGDAHIYNRYPTSWKFVTGFANLAQNTKPFFLSEAGIGSVFNCVREEEKMREAGAPASAYAWNWIKPDADGLRKTWATFGLYDVYPSIEDMLVDSEISASHQREMIFSIVRSNPKVNGYNLTSIVDAWGAGEGVMNSFREFKAGHLAVLQAGWAPLRWCLLVNPANVYTDRPLHVRVALANEDRLAPGSYPATLRISGVRGVVWTRSVTARVQDGPDAPLAYPVLDEDVTIPGLSEGTYSLEATLDTVGNAAASTLSFTVTDGAHSPESLGDITVLGLNKDARDFLTSRGARLHDYAEGERIDREVILVGESFSDHAKAWRALYARVACGAHAVFLSTQVFRPDLDRKQITWADGERSPVRWLAVNSTLKLNTDKQGLVETREWLYHKEVVAKRGPAFAGLQPRLMTPDFYGDLLEDAYYFDAVAVPDETEAVALRCGFYIDFGTEAKYEDGVVLGTYGHHAGHFTINGFDLLGHLGNPAADRLLLNLVKEAASDAAQLKPLPSNYDAEMDSLGIRDKL
jgi:hypothetical protein